jgi:hypothetical protein
VNRYLLLLLLAAGGAGAAAAGTPRDATSPAPLPLPAQRAIGVRVDTLLLGGFAVGGYAGAIRTLASDLSEEERELVGSHLERIFAGPVPGEGLGRGGRLRVAYERAVRPDGSTRSIRVLGAEMAAGGRLQTAFYFEREDQPGYYDPFGRSLDASAWGEPLAAMRVTSPFGEHRMHPILERVLPHTGVDLAAPLGEPVLATAEGVVSFAGVRGGYGLTVEIQHASGFTTRYAHLSALEPGVSAARLVRQGEPIGSVGMSGLATGPHLHYEVLRRGRPIDPGGVVRDAGIAMEIGADARWSRERRRIADLLARTPTLTRSAAAAGTGS